MASEKIGANYASTTSSYWSIRVDGDYINGIRDYLVEDDFPKESIVETVNSAANTLGYCPNPADEAICQKTGIIIGKVQSGKTSNFISLTALAFDNGYDIAVVFGGTKDRLVKQNRERIAQYFEKLPNVNVLNAKENADLINAEEVQGFIRDGKKVIIVCLKHKKWIEAIRKDVFSDRLLARKPVLLIDDEGDEYSLNTLVNRGKKSTIYSEIESFKRTLSRHAFISVTATPQANLLIDALDIISPDFGVLVKPGKGYCGIEEFHGDRSHIVEIPETEDTILETEGIPESFEKALASFFVACGFHKNRGMPAKKVSMLIHPSVGTIDHDYVNEKLNKLLKNWKDSCSDKTDIAYEDVRNKFVAAYNEYVNTTVSDAPEFETIEDDVIRAILTCKTHVINFNNRDSDNDKFFDYNIYIGGALLGRGLTFKGLTVTYIIRSSKVSNVDTEEQMARWFGYRESYFDLCRVYALSKIITDFEAILDHEADVWQTIEETNLQGVRFKDMVRIFRLGSSGLRATRTSVARTQRFIFKPIIYQRIFMRDPDYTNSNINVLREFKESHKKALTYRKYGEGAGYTILSGLKFSQVTHDLLDRYRFPDGSEFNNSLIAKFNSILNRKQMDPETDIIWMRDEEGQYSEHAVGENGVIRNYLVGRRPKDKAAKTIYEGDRYQFARKGSIQIQIHLIRDTITGEISPAIVLGFPNDIIEEMADLVERA